MFIEYEASFLNIEKDEVRDRLRRAGATLARPEFLQKRVVFHFPKGHEVNGGWVRVRDEGDRVTMSVKIVDGDRIHDQREIGLMVDDFSTAVLFLETLGCVQKSYQETKRELWLLDEGEITIDEWPFLNPFVEIEGPSEDIVKQVAQKVGFDYTQAVFGAVDVKYMRQYPQLTFERINTTPRIIFDMTNPFLE